ncbi:enolase [Synergistales bacterium]|nr:enolase [Synergistales bacterium]
MGRAGASTGSSVGANESFVLRDNDPKLFGGLSVYKAIENVEKIIAPALIGLDVLDQEKVDRTMLALDGTRYKTKLGGNAIFAVSVANARVAAEVKGLPLHEAMASKEIKYMYAPASNVVNGGTYIDKTLAFQEFMVIPHSVKTFQEGVRIVVEVFQRLGDVIKKENGRTANMGNYSGYGAPSDDPLVVFQMITEAVKQLGYEKNVAYAMDCASSEFYDDKEKAYRYRGKLVDRNEIITVLANLAEKYPIVFIEDALEEEDFEGFKLAAEKINTVIIGDDFLCTSIDRAKKAVEMGAAKGMIFKPNQAGTVTEALETAHYILDHDLLLVPSGRAGGVLDSPEKEIGIALGCYLAKSGAPRSGSRTAGINLAIRVAEELKIPMADIKNLPCFSHIRFKLEL